MKRFTAIALASLAAACSNGAGPADMITVKTMGANGASCELSDDWGNRFVVAQTPGAVEVPSGSGDLRVLCQKAGYETAFSQVPEGAGGGLLYFLGWTDSAGGYPAEVGVEMVPTMTAGAQGQYGLPQGRPATNPDAGQQYSSESLGAPQGTRFAASGMAPEGPPPIPAQQASGSDLMGGSASSTGQRTWGETISAGAAPPPAPVTLAPTGGQRVQTSSLTPAKPRLATGGGVGPYSVQVGAFLDNRNADLMSRALKSRGYQPEVVTTKDRTGREWVRVRFGSYLDKNSAKSALIQVRAPTARAASSSPAAG